ncbi:MAG: SRPBCC family protein [Chitinispirillaceae bacterium]|nr:SRPBCC family protein [Chitinispirillaceae bacterium]
MVTGNTVKLHRILKAKPERVYRAFLDPEAIVKWLPPYGFIGKMHHSNAHVDGVYRMSFTNFSTGRTESFTGVYRELRPNELIRYTDRFDDPGMPGETQTTVSLKEVMGATELSITQEGIPGAIPVEYCYIGWQESLTLLALLVEPEIPDSQ